MLSQLRAGAGFPFALIVEDMPRSEQWGSVQEELHFEPANELLGTQLAPIS